MHLGLGLGPISGRGSPAPKNWIRNNTMVGAVAATPGTIPTNWIANTSINSLVRQIVGTGTEAGIDYIDIKWSGTPSASGNITLAQFDGTQIIPALIGQTWTASTYVKLSTGALTNVSSLFHRVLERTAAGGALTSTDASFTPTTAGLETQRVVTTRTLTSGTTAFIISAISFNYTSGSPIDVTFRIGLPQLETGASATAPIRTP